MAPVVAVLLMHMTAEVSFHCILHSVLKNYFEPKLFSSLEKLKTINFMRDKNMVSFDFMRS